MFSRTIRMVFRAIFTASGKREGLSSMSTISADSMAASLPMAPMAMPTSARVSTGASLMPSPTKASLQPEESSVSTCSTFWAGSSSARYWSTPSFSATVFATASASPVSITVCRMPRAFRSAKAWAESGLSWSLMTMWPRYSLPRARWMMVPTRSQSWTTCAPTFSIREALPT